MSAARGVRGAPATAAVAAPSTDASSTARLRNRCAGPNSETGCHHGPSKKASAMKGSSASRTRDRAGEADAPVLVHLVNDGSPCTTGTKITVSGGLTAHGRVLSMSAAVRWLAAWQVGGTSRPVSRVLSPPRGAGDGHPSRTSVAAGLVRSTPELGRAALGRSGRAPAGAPLDLAPGGVCRATRVTPGAGGLLPHRFTLAGKPAVCFLWHFPAGHPGSLLATTLPCGARTFLDSWWLPRPSGRLVPARGYCPGFPAPAAGRCPVSLRLRTTAGPSANHCTSDSAVRSRCIR